MTLNASGPLSLGGSTVGQSINLELGQSATATASINATNFRTLAGVASGQISISNFYGKSNAPTGQTIYSTPGIYSWIAPAGVTSVSVFLLTPGAAGAQVEATCCCCIGRSYGGGGGGGGATAYRNNLSVTPGTSYNVIINTYNTTYGGLSSCSFTGNSGLGVLGTAAYPGNYSGVGAGGQGGQGLGGQWYSNGGSGGGASGGTKVSFVRAGGGGGAGGYTGTINTTTGGAGGSQGVSGSAGVSGSGAAGGGSGSAAYYVAGAGGGGIGTQGLGSTGAGGVYTANTSAGGGGGGSGGGTASTATTNTPTAGGAYGGGGGGATGSVGAIPGGAGGAGFIRIIWPGTTRAFPSTNTADM